MKSKILILAGVVMIGALTVVVPSTRAQALPETTSTVPVIQQQAPVPPVPLIPPVPTLFDASSSTLMEQVSSTRPMPIPLPERELSTGTREVVVEKMMALTKEDDEDTTVSSSDTPAVRLKKLAKYWAVYRELGSDKMYAITTSGTKREIQTLTFFTKIDSNFGMRLMPKGSLDQFAAGEAITSVDGLDFSSFRKLAQPCRLIKTADKPVVYLACLGIKRAVQSEKAFRLFGWDFKQVQTASVQDVDGMKVGESVSESTVFEQGIQIDTAGMKQEPQKSDEKQMGQSASSELIVIKGSRVVKVQGSTKMFLITADGKRHYLPNMQIVKALKIDLSKAQVITTQQLSAFSEGESLTVENVSREIMKVDLPAMTAPATGSAPATGAAPATAPYTPPVMTATSTMPILPQMTGSEPLPSVPTSSTQTGTQKPIAYLIKVGGGDGAIYLVTPDNKKHRVYNTQGLGDRYAVQPLKEVTKDQLDTLQDGEAIGTPPVI